MRTAEVKRKTAETDIEIRVDLDGDAEKSVIDSGIGFLDHMLTLLSRHAAVEMKVLCKGDTEVDDHHSTEDIGIALGKAMQDALGDKKGIRRYASIALPMDEALVLCALDLSGRSSFHMQVSFAAEKIGTFDTQLVKEFFLGLTRSCPMSLHFQKMAGENDHHVAEAMFKGFGRALAEAVAPDPRLNGAVPSSKGVLA